LSAPEFRTIEAAAFQLAALLERYEEHVEELTSTWLDMELYVKVGKEVDEMRLHCATLPQLSVPWVHLLISHTELVHCLWKTSPDGQPSAKLADCRGKHAIAIRALREKCTYYFSRMDRSH
jgi:hypothetical protein